MNVHNPHLKLFRASVASVDFRTSLSSLFLGLLVASPLWRFLSPLAMAWLAINIRKGSTLEVVESVFLALFLS